MKLHPDLQQRLDAMMDEEPPARWELDQADAMEWLGSRPSESAHLVITDPPYSSLEGHRQVGTTTRLTNDWFDVVENDYFRPLFLEIWRVMRKNAHFYCFCDQTTLPVVRDAAEFAGLRWHKFLVWDKEHIGMGYHYRAQHELIAFMSREGCRALNDRSIGDVLRCPRVHGGYPTEKPVELIRTLVTQSSAGHQYVLDPFAGSGSTGDACLRENRRFRGCDVSAEAVEAARERLESVEEECDG